MNDHERMVALRRERRNRLRAERVKIRRAYSQKRKAWFVVVKRWEPVVTAFNAWRRYNAVEQMLRAIGFTNSHRSYGWLSLWREVPDGVCPDQACEVAADEILEALDELGEQ